MAIALDIAGPPRRTGEIKFLCCITPAPQASSFTFANTLMQQSSNSLQKGIAYMVCGTAIVPIMDALAKILGETMSPLQITWGRFFFQCLIMGLILVVLRQPITPKRPTIHCARGLLLAAATVCFFWALRYLPLADAIAIFFVQPLILTVLSGVFLGEKIGWHRKIAVTAGFIGVLFIIRPGAESFHPAALLPLASAVLFACYMVITRAYVLVDSAIMMQFASGLSATVVLTLLLMLSVFSPLVSQLFIEPSKTEWLYLLGIGAISAAGHLLVVMAINNAPTSLLAPFGYVEIVAATILGWLFFHDWPKPLTWLGIAIIVSSGIVVFARERKLAKSAAEGVRLSSK